MTRSVRRVLLAAPVLALKFAGWAPELTALITDGDTPLVPRPIYTLPAEHRWDRVPGVTLLGDAAHLASPQRRRSQRGDARRRRTRPGCRRAPRRPRDRARRVREGHVPRAAAAAADTDFLLMFADDAPHGVIAKWTGAEQAL
jgi:hypothetical protein